MQSLSFTRRIRLMWRAMRDPRTPLPAKVIVVLGLVYAVSPIDIIPDVLPVIGWTDDIAILIAAFAAFWKIAQHVLNALNNEEPSTRSTRPSVIDVKATEHRHH